MSDQEFDALAIRALAPQPDALDAAARERVWGAVVRGRQLRWVPTIPETCLAAAFACFCLGLMVWSNTRPYPLIEPAYQMRSANQPPIEKTFRAVSRVAGLPRLPR